jgi:hypothetical protein
MANTYTLISSNTLSSSAASVTFSSIPSTYTDLVLKVSARNTEAVTINQLNVAFDSNSGNTAHSRTQLSGDGSAAASSRQSNNSIITVVDVINSANSTANTFSSYDIYIPSYTASQNKPVSLDTTTEQNATLSYRIITAGLWRNTSAVSTIILSGGGGSFASGSSFYLYGIKNS